MACELFVQVRSTSLVETAFVVSPDGAASGVLANAGSEAVEDTPFTVAIT